MGDNIYFSHTSLDGTQFYQRIIAAGYTNYIGLAENIAMAYGAPSASQVYSMWNNSPGHYANMIGDYVDAGLGVYTINGYTYYTLDLGKATAQHLPQLPLHDQPLLLLLSQPQRLNLLLYQPQQPHQPHLQHQLTPQLQRQPLIQLQRQPQNLLQHQHLKHKL